MQAFVQAHRRWSLPRCCTAWMNLLERTPCPVGGLCASDTCSCRLLQGPPQLGAIVMLLFSWLPTSDLAKPPRAWPFPPIPGLLRALCWVCTNAQWCPILLLPFDFATITPNAPLHSYPCLTPSQQQLPDNPASSGAVIKPCAQTDWILKNLGLKRTNGVTFDWPSKRRELQERKWELGLWIGTCLEDRN